MTARYYRPISSKLLRSILVSALIFSLLFEVTLLITSHLQSRYAEKQKIVDVAQSVKIPLISAIKNNDSYYANQIISELIRLPTIQNSSVIDQDGRVLASIPSTFIQPYQAELKQYSLALTIDEQVSSHAKLNIHWQSQHDFYQLLNEQAWSILFSGLIRAILLAIIIYIICHQLFSKPITQLIDNLQDIDLTDPKRNQLTPIDKHSDDEFAVVVNTTNQMLNSIWQHQQLKEKAESVAHHLAQHDALTALANRNQLQEFLRKAIHRAQANKNQVALFICGINNFSAINESYGQKFGDNLLAKVANELNTTFTATSLIARIDGDQFAVVQEHIKSTEETAELAETIIQTIGRTHLINHLEVNITCSIGIACYPRDGMNNDEIFMNANKAMEQIKTTGKNNFQIYHQSVDKIIHEKKTLENDLASALYNNELELYFQGQFDNQTGHFMGAEVLLRWKHKTKGYIPSDIFIPIAEKTQHIVAIGKWVIHKACEQVKIWQQQFPQLNPVIAINLSTVQLNHHELISIVRTALAESKIQPQQLEFEITETSILQKVEQSICTLNTLKKMGVGISLDDFGTGYSSLSYLKRLPIQKLKIDKEFINGLPNDPDDAIIVQTISQLCHSLNLTMVAEGVENKQQREYLSNIGCEISQGYYFHRPMNSKNFMDFLHTHLSTTDKNLVAL